MRRLRLLLDSNVLVDAQVRDLLCRLDEAEMVDLRWSDRILEEVDRVLLHRLGIEAESLRRLEAALTAAFPEASVTVEEKIESSCWRPSSAPHWVRLFAPRSLRYVGQH